MADKIEDDFGEETLEEDFDSGSMEFEESSEIAEPKKEFADEKKKASEERIEKQEVKKEETKKGKEEKPKEKIEKGPGFIERLKKKDWDSWYNKNHTKFLILTLGVLLIAIGFIAFHYFTTGDFVDRDVSLKGGVSITVFKNLDFNVGEYLKTKYPNSDISVRVLTSGGTPSGYIIESSDLQNNDILAALNEKTHLSKDDYTEELIGSTLGASFFRQAIFAVLIAFLFMSIVVFIYFRIPIPCLAVVLAAFSSIVCTWAVILALGVKLSSAGIAAFLMLIGYSVDTDMLLTARVLRRKGSVNQAIKGAMKTGLTMTGAALVSVLVAYFYTQSGVIKQIMLVLIIGLLFDIFNTWLQNATLIKWYVENKMKKKA